VGLGVGLGDGLSVAAGAADGAGDGDSLAEASAAGVPVSQSQSVVCGLAEGSWLGAPETAANVGSSLAVWSVEQADAIRTSDARMASTRPGPRVVIMPTLRAMSDRGSRRC